MAKEIFENGPNLINYLSLAQKLSSNFSRNVSLRVYVHARMDGHAILSLGCDKVSKINNLFDNIQITYKQTNKKLWQCNLDLALLDQQQFSSTIGSLPQIAIRTVWLKEPWNSGIGKDFFSSIYYDKTYKF